MMTEVEENLDKGHMIETKEGIPYLEADPQTSIIQEAHTKDRTLIERKVEVDNKV